jgi:aminoglycoside 2'-N-acetyltransferase I
MSPLLDAEWLRLMAQAMPSIWTARTAEIEPELLAQIRALLEEVFAGDFTEHDWQHALGGLHALAYEGDELVGHGSVVERRLECDGRALRTGYVEGIGVKRRHQRRGHGAAIMAALEEEIRARYELGALGATDEAVPLYTGRGWVRWSGPTEPDGEGAVYVLPLAVPVDPATATLRADWREGDIW